ncbi:MAG: NADPH:quinone reductase [Haloferacaceae archaeon]
MRAVRYHEYGDESVLRVDDVPDPGPGVGEALVSIRAASVNPIDAKLREGIPSPPPSLPHVAGVDLAGVVESVGPGVDRLAPGDRVYGTGFGWDDPGTYAEKAAVPADRLAVLSDAVDFETGAAAAMVFATAWRALVDRGDLSVGDTCLVHGAAGGVGHAGVQIAANAGATVVGTARDADADAVREFGADAVVDYRTDDLGSAVRDAVGAVDVVLETHAGANLHGDLASLGRGGRAVVIGQGQTLTLDPGTSLSAMFDDVDVRFMSTMASTDDHARVLGRLVPLLADGRLEPRIDATYALAEAAAAQRYAAQSGVTGKVVLRTDGEK